MYSYGLDSIGITSIVAASTTFPIEIYSSDDGVYDQSSAYFVMDTSLAISPSPSPVTECKIVIL